MTEVVVTTGLLELQVVQSSSQIITTNKPTSSFFTGRMPFLSPNQQCQSTEGKNPSIQINRFLPNLVALHQTVWACIKEIEKMAHLLYPKTFCGHTCGSKLAPITALPCGCGCIQFIGFVFVRPYAIQFILFWNSSTTFNC